MTPQHCLQQLRDHLGNANVITDKAKLQPYLHDWRGRYQGEALAVVCPQDTMGVAHTVKCCRTAGIAIVPQGGNTSLCGGATPRAHERSIILHTGDLNRLRHVDADNATLTIEAGCTLKTLQQHALDAGLFFPVSLGSETHCTIGGNLSTNAGGTAVLRYGNTRDQVLGLEVVLADGSIWNGLRALRKDNSGYDLKHLFIGAEGTLGIITAAVLKLQPRLHSTLTTWVGINNIDDVITLFSHCQKRFGANLIGFELMSRLSQALVLQQIPNTIHPLTEIPPWSVLIELGDTASHRTFATEFDELLTTIPLQKPTPEYVMTSESDLSQALWRFRENIGPAQKQEGLSQKHDISLPISCIPRFLVEAEQALQTQVPNIRIVVFGHVGDGNLHYNLSITDPEQNPSWVKQYTASSLIVHNMVMQLGGSIAAEHGVGQLKPELIAHYKPAIESQLMRQIKQALDPDGLFNPGKVICPA